PRHVGTGAAVALAGGRGGTAAAQPGQPRGTVGAASVGVAARGCALGGVGGGQQLGGTPARGRIEASPLATTHHQVKRVTTTTPPQGSRLFYVALVLVSLFLLGNMLLPFASALFLAAVLAGSLFGLQQSLSRRMGGRPALAAGVLTLLLVLAVAGPL